MGRFQNMLIQQISFSMAFGIRDSDGHHVVGQVPSVDHEVS